MADPCHEGVEEGEEERDGEADGEEERAGGNASDDVPSQACFVLHPGSIKAAKGAETTPSKTSIAGNKRKRGGNKHEFLLPLPPCLEDEPGECGLWRAEALRSTSDKMEEGVKEVFKARNMKAFKEIHNFIYNSIFCDAQLQLYLSPLPSSTVRLSKQLNTALLYLRNVDSSDHTTTFVELNSYLQNNNCHVANLLPQNFSAKGGMGSALNSILKQIVKITPETSDMDILASWHRIPENAKHPIVIIVEDAELCNAEVLADFIITLSEWLAQLPLVLVMGMATSVDAMRRLLPASAARHLHVQAFTLPSPNDYLEGVIKATLLNPSILFGICCNTLKFLIGYYEKYDSTVTSFLRALKMACMEHFWSQPLSFLCARATDSNQTPGEDSLGSLNGSLLHYASKLPSVQSMKYDAEHDIHKELVTGFDSLRVQKRKWSTTLQCLFAAGKLLGLDSIKIMSEMLEIQTEKTLSNEFVASKGDVIQWSHTEPNSAIATMLKRLRDASELVIHKMLTKLLKWTEHSTERRIEVQDMLQKLMSEASIEEESLNDSEKSSRRKQLLFGASGEKQPKFVLNDIPAVNGSKVQEVSTMNATVDCSNASRGIQLMSTIGHEAVVIRAGGSPAMLKKQNSKLIGKMLANFVEKMMKECLIPLESLPFSEIMCFKNVGNIRQTLIGDPRKVIQRDVQYPQITLQCNCCGTNDGNLSDSMNDSSILFRLAQTHGDQVNLFEVYQSFSAVVDTPIIEEGGKKKSQKSPRKVIQKADQALLQARFCKAASELQLVGLFHMPSKKRPDFVQLAL